MRYFLKETNVDLACGIPLDTNEHNNMEKSTK